MLAFPNSYLLSITSLNHCLGTAMLTPQFCSSTLFGGRTLRYKTDGGTNQEGLALYVTSESIFPPLNLMLSRGTYLGSVHSLDVFQSSL